VNWIVNLFSDWTGGSPGIVRLFFLAALGLLCFGILRKTIFCNKKWEGRKELKKLIRSKQFLFWQDFEKNWLADGKGYKYQDTPGCYVILSFKKRPSRNHLERFDDVYVGQSVHLCQRVHNHFNGKGNGDIYADLRYGRFVYVALIPCKQRDLNENEKILIEAFDATTSYNKTKGGARNVD
jgi:hypothetical protein